MRRLFDGPLLIGRSPTADAPDQVVAWPGWRWWRDENGRPHARHGQSVVDADDFTGLLDRIREAENE